MNNGKQYTQKAFSAVDGALDKGSKLHLSIQCDLNGLCFCILDLPQNKYVALKYTPYPAAVVDYNDFPKMLWSILENEPLLKLNFASVQCMYTSRSTTLIPQDLSNINSLKAFLEFNAPLNELDEVHSAAVDWLNAEAVFAIPSPLASTLFEKFGQVSYYNQCVPLLNLLPKQAKHCNTGNVLWVNSNQGFADIALYCGGNLKIYNTFEVLSPTDLLYYMHAIAQQHKLDTRLISVLLSGHCEIFEKNIAKFFPLVNFAQTLTDADFTHKLRKYADHRFTHLFALYQCA